jgi:L-ascorbate metabolism protein UlaG (beta-lactamase superfamily)
MSPTCALTWLGVAGWHVRTLGGSLLIDPYFSRLPLAKLLSGRISPDTDLIGRYTPPADWVLVSHAHYDHLLDVPDVAHLTGATVYASPQGGHLLDILGVPARQIGEIGPGARLALGEVAVEVYPSEHRLVMGQRPFAGPLRPNLRPPLRVGDYRMDALYSFRVCAAETSLLFCGGFHAEPAILADALLIQVGGTAEQYRAILDRTRPRLVIPTHWDDMFHPLDAPLRPMWALTPGGLPRPRRVDVGAFARLIQRLAPTAEMLIPARLTPYRLPTGP